MGKINQKIKKTNDKDNKVIVTSKYTESFKGMRCLRRYYELTTSHSGREDLRFQGTNKLNILREIV